MKSPKVSSLQQVCTGGWSQTSLPSHSLEIRHLKQKKYLSTPKSVSIKTKDPNDYFETVMGTLCRWSRSFTKKCCTMPSSLLYTIEDNLGYLQKRIDLLNHRLCERSSRMKIKTRMRSFCSRSFSDCCNEFFLCNRPRWGIRIICKKKVSFKIIFCTELAEDGDI